MSGDLWLALHSVTRWHTHPHLARAGQTVADHTAGMIALGLTFWPDMSRDLMVAIMYHDAAESIIGDMPGPAKGIQPLGSMLAAVEGAVRERNGWLQNLSPEDASRAAFLDQLEAYRFANMHAPWALNTEHSGAVRQWLRDSAAKLGVDPAPHIGEAWA